MEHEPISSFELMNRAAEAFTNWFSTIYVRPNQSVLVVCGTGNNGGDGLAVARLLRHRFFEAKVWVLDFPGAKRGADFVRQMDWLPEDVERRVVSAFSEIGDVQISADAIVVDAIFGSGLSRAPGEDFAQIIGWLNALPNERIAIDLPSGLFADRHTEGPCIFAARTFSFQTPKIAFFFPENAEKTGEWAFGNIGLHPGFEEKTDTPFHYLTAADAHALRKPRGKFSHKGTFGHALLVAGSLGKMGAAILAARACVRSGAGLLTVHVPRTGLETLQAAVPEAMCSPDPVQDVWSLVPGDLERFAAIGVGPGIGTSSRAARALEMLLKKSPVPLVLDADALNLLAGNPDWWPFLPKNSLLTPHPKEFERLFGNYENDFHRNEIQREMAIRHGVFVILKGANTAIACPDGDCWFNSTGNPGMATGGSGDVLTGLLTGLLAQGCAPKTAALLGVFLHGLAGDLAAREHGQEGLTAGDLAAFLGRAWVALRHVG